MERRLKVRWVVQEVFQILTAVRFALGCPLEIRPEEAHDRLASSGKSLDSSSVIVQNAEWTEQSR